jgi:3-oxoacyl-[acyl-carrier protein] reductase
VADFGGKIVVVTGGGQGIGLATVSAFEAAGATVVVWDRNGREAPVDVADVDGVQRAANAVLAQHGRVDVLINNAGINFGIHGADTITDATWDAILATNLKGTVNTVRAVSPAMVRRGRGRIINTSSILARFPLPLLGAYAASKAGIEALTRGWARELGPHGITVNAIAPGFIDTAFNAGQPDEIVQEVVRRTPVGRPGTAVDVACVHLFLASDQAGFINGAIVPVDGGLTL